LASEAGAQQGASLADRRGLFRRSAQEANAAQNEAEQQAQWIHDSQVMPAAAQAPQKASGQSAPSGRRPVQNPAPRKNGGLFSRLSMPNLIPHSLRRDDEDELEPPMPYDPQELRSQGPSRQGSSAASASRSQQSGSPTNSAGQFAPRSTPPSGASASRTPAPKATPAPAFAPATVRSSPSTDGRRNELAEALSGLQDSDQPSANVTSKQPPAPAAEETTPSYLRPAAKPTTTKPAPAAVAAAPRKSPPALRTAPARPVDVRDALLGKFDSTDEIGPTPEDGDSANLTKEPPRVAETLPEIEPSPSPVANENLVGVEPSTPAGEQLGDIPAQTTPSMAPAPAVPPAASSPTTPRRPTDFASTTDLRPGRDVLMSARQPVIVSKVEGPQRIIVGRPAEYKITLENRGDEAARDVAARVAVPASADVVDALASNGVVDRTAAESGVPAVNWQLYELAPGASQTLTLQLVPRSGQPMQLGVEWSQAAVSSQTTVEVQEPKLQMEIAGPSEVLFGKPQRYSLTLSNPGTGAAEDVSIALTPPGGDQSSVVHHRIGTLAPGQSKKIELELTAREAGDLKIQAAATGAGELKSSAVKNVLCRKAELEIDWRGPDKNFAGAVVTYFFRVRNPGTAPADQVAVTVELPKGAELVDASEGHKWDAANTTIVWQSADLAASEQRFMQLRCRLSKPGVNTLALAARTAAGDLTNAKTVPVTVEALADLKLEVSDPSGIVPVGESAAYEIRVSNRGSIAARVVNVVAMFSEGIDPSHVEGGQSTIRDGRVSFRAIDNLAAGSEAVFRIHAKASKPGTHIFRAEVVCDDLDTKLSAEETTRFFIEEQRWADASSAYGAEPAPATR